MKGIEKPLPVIGHGRTGEIIVEQETAVEHPVLQSYQEIEIPEVEIDVGILDPEDVTIIGAAVDAAGVA